MLVGRTLFCAVSAAIFALLALPVRAGSATLDHLRDQYRGKTLILRGFYSGDHLHYDASGILAAGSNPGDWISDGFVQVNDIRSSHHHLVVEAERQLVIHFHDQEFAFLREKVSKIDKHPLRIEADFDPSKTSPDQADAAMVRIFLTAKDDLSALVPNYWKPCLRAASAKSRNFSFSSDLGAIPGVGASTTAGVVPADSGAAHAMSCLTQKSSYGRAVSPPRAIYSPEPEFSDLARRARFQGTELLMLAVNEDGIPDNIRVTEPLGYGLDEKAISAVKKWRFRPAEKDGQPIPASITIEVTFHLY